MQEFRNIAHVAQIDETTTKAIIDWRQQWEYLNHILPAIPAHRIKAYDEGEFYFFDKQLVYTMVAGYMLQYEQYGDILSLGKLLMIGLDGDWLAKAKSWSALSYIESDILIDSKLLARTEHENNARNRFLVAIASGIRFRLQRQVEATQQDELREKLLQQLTRGKGLRRQQSVDTAQQQTTSTNTEPSILDAWFGEVRDEKGENNATKKPKIKTKAFNRWRARQNNKVAIQQTLLDFSDP